MKIGLTLIFFLAFLPFAEAQINVVDGGAVGNQINLGSIYTQSFDSLANTTTAPQPWTNNGTLPGWYAYRQSSPVNVYNPSQGGGGPLSSYGILGEADFALGSALGIPSGDVLHFGVQFVNASSSMITGFDISFDGEQWYYGTRFGSIIESLTFSFQIFDAGQGSLSAVSGWIQLPNLEFVSPVNSGSALRALNGNLPANRIEGIAESFTGLTLAPGQELWLRWTATNTASITDDALAIDNLSVRFHSIPEPATCAVFAGCLVLFSALRRRRR